MSTTRATPGLRAARTARGLTQVELSERAEVQQVTISALERRGPGRSVEIAIRLARALNTSVEALFATDLVHTEVHTTDREPVRSPRSSR